MDRICLVAAIAHLDLANDLDLGSDRIRDRQLSAEAEQSFPRCRFALTSWWSCVALPFRSLAFQSFRSLSLLWDSRWPQKCSWIVKAERLAAIRFEPEPRLFAEIADDDKQRIRRRHHRSRAIRSQQP